VAHQGDTSYSRRARRYMPLPVIRLDYVIDDYQVYEARAWQSDAVTVPEAFLSDGQILGLMEVCRELEMTPVIMTDTLEGAERAAELGAEYLLAMPLAWDGKTDVPPDEVDRMAQICPGRVRLIGYVPLLQRESVEHMAEAGVHAVLGAPASHDPSEAAIMIRQLHEIPRRIRQ
jgi:indole-3-glycerol phosphate synthase